MKSLNEELINSVNEKFKMVMAQREEILTAFVAKYGMQPEEIIQVEWRKSSTQTFWFIQHKESMKCCTCENYIKADDKRDFTEKFMEQHFGAEDKKVYD